MNRPYSPRLRSLDSQEHDRASTCGERKEVKKSRGEAAACGNSSPSPSCGTHTPPLSCESASSSPAVSSTSVKSKNRRMSSSSALNAGAEVVATRAAVKPSTNLSPADPRNSDPFSNVASYQSVLETQTSNSHGKDSARGTAAAHLVPLNAKPDGNSFSPSYAAHCAASTPSVTGNVMHSCRVQVFRALSLSLSLSLSHTHTPARG